MDKPVKKKRGLLRSLNMFIWVQRLLNRFRWMVNTKVWGMDIDKSVVISLSAKLDRTNPSGIHIGKDTYVAFQAVILSHDMCRALKTDTYIGSNCFIGGKSIILPGISVGDGSIVGAGSVVTRDVPPGSIVVGNPAKVIRSDIKVREFGILLDS